MDRQRVRASVRFNIKVSVSSRILPDLWAIDSPQVRSTDHNLHFTRCLTTTDTHNLSNYLLRTDSFNSVDLYHMQPAGTSYSMHEIRETFDLRFMPQISLDNI